MIRRYRPADRSITCPILTDLATCCLLRRIELQQSVLQVTSQLLGNSNPYALKHISTEIADELIEVRIPKNSAYRDANGTRASHLKIVTMTHHDPPHT